eukprot:1789868-Amphidinium_carterae.1
MNNKYYKTVCIGKDQRQNAYHRRLMEASVRNTAQKAALLAFDRMVATSMVSEQSSTWTPDKDQGGVCGAMWCAGLSASKGSDTTDCQMRTTRRYT